MTAADLINELLENIRAQFYPEDYQRFAQQERILKRALTYPASWLKQRGVELPIERQKAILLERLQEIKRHGQTAAIKHFGGYFLHVVQQHFEHQGEHYYNEGKTLRAKLSQALASIPVGQARPTEDSERLAELHNLLLPHKRKRRTLPQTA